MRNKGIKSIIEETLQENKANQKDEFYFNVKVLYLDGNQEVFLAKLTEDKVQKFRNNLESDTTVFSVELEKLPEPWGVKQKPIYKFFI